MKLDTQGTNLSNKITVSSTNVKDIERCNFLKISSIIFCLEVSHQELCSEPTIMEPSQMYVAEKCKQRAKGRPKPGAGRREKLAKLS